VQQFLRRLTGITAIALAGVVLGLAQTTSQPAQGGKAADKPAEKKKNYKDQQEYTLYDSVTKEADANKKLALLNTWKEKYADSDFKMDRLKIFLTTYQQLGKPDKMVDTAKEILALDPKDIQALYWITFLTPSLGNNSADVLDTAEKAANGLLAAEKPAEVKDEDWTKAKAQTDGAAYTTLGWIAMQRKNNDLAETNFKKALTINPAAVQVSYWLGTVILAEKKPEKQAEALYDFARAAAYDGPGALAPDGRKTIDAYLTKVYTALHGDNSGLAELKATAKANPMPPADFKIKTKAEIDAAKEEELKKTNPQFALWKGIKESLVAADGQDYFDKSVKGFGLPGGANGVAKFRGWLVKADPALKSKMLQISMEGKDQPADVTLKLVGSDGTTAAPLPGKPDIGYWIEFEGTGDSFTKDPFMLTFDVEKSKIVACSGDPLVCSGPLKEEKVAPVHHPAAHKKS
jgi:tetratricopeptide (TPR) repeat protein